MSYKINQPIRVRYKTIPLITGMTDLYLTPTNPSGTDQPALLMTEIGSTGIYQITFTPNATGNWQARAFSSTYTDQRDCKSFFIGTEYDLYPAQENGNLLNIKNNSDIISGELETYAALAIGSATNANKYHSNLFNNIGSTVILKIYKIELTVQMNGLITGHNISFVVIRSSTLGTGTASTISKLDTNLANINASVSIIKSLTVAPTVNAILAIGNIDTEDTRPGNKCILFNACYGVSPIILRAGEGVAVKQDSYSSSGDLQIIYYLRQI